MMYLTLQLRLYPFKHKRVNIMETVCMFLLIMALFLVSLELHEEYPEIIAVIMTIIVLIPCIILLAYIFLVIHHRRMDNKDFKAVKQSNGDINNLYQNARIDSMISRLNTEERRLFMSQKVDDGPNPTDTTVVYLTGSQWSVKVVYGQLDIHKLKQIGW